MPSPRLTGFRKRHSKGILTAATNMLMAATPKSAVLIPIFWQQNYCSRWRRTWDIGSLILADVNVGEGQKICIWNGGPRKPILDTKTTDLLETVVKIWENRFTAANAFQGEIWDGPISKYFFHYVLYICAKFHACIVKRTINSHIGWARLQYVS